MQAVQAVSRASVDNKLLMYRGGERRIIQCPYRDPVIIDLDVTGSMGDLVYLVHDKSMRVAGQIPHQGYLGNPGFSFAAHGDANPDSRGGPPDRVPLQVTDFAHNPESVKSLLEDISLEERGGGGQGMESYDLPMFAYAHCCEYPADVRKGFYFIIGDEGYYPETKAEHLREHFGIAEASSMPAKTLFEDLKAMFHVFVLHLDATSNYSTATDARIQRQWRDAFGERAINLTEPQAVVDIILGCIAGVSQSRTLDEYVDKDLLEQGQTEQRRAVVSEALRPLEEIDWQL